MDRGPGVRVFRQALRLAVSLLLAGLVACLARIPMGQPKRDATLRLALRTAGGRVEICRDRTPEELAELPAHMRQPRACDRHLLPYRLTVRVDGEPRIDRRVTSAGVHEDRPLVVDEALDLPPGRVGLEVVFVPDPGGEAPLEGALAAAWESAPRYRLAESAELKAGRITLVALDDEAGRFRIYGE